MIVKDKQNKMKNSNETSQAPYSALTIADEILKIAKSKQMRLTPMQLTKLAYIAHGWNLAILGKPLIRESVEAWKYGPVIPEIYHATKDFGRDTIPFNLIDFSSASKLGNGELHLLEDVVIKYGKFSGPRLSTMTHLYGTPWQQVYKPNMLATEIPNATIKKYYDKKLEEHKADSAPAR